MAIAASIPCGFAATVIDLDDLPLAEAVVRFAPSNHYQAFGAVFSRDIPYSDRAWPSAPASYWPSRGGSVPHFIVLNPPAPRDSIEIRFVIPGTTIPATTDFVRAQFGDTEDGSNIGLLEAFDSSGALLASRTATTPIEETLVLEVRASGIARVRFSTDTDGNVVDNIAFGSLTSSIGTNVTLQPVLAIEAAVQVRWESQVSRQYQVQWSSSLDTNWHALGFPLLGSGAVLSYCDVTTSRDRRFYRVVVLE